LMARGVKRVSLCLSLYLLAPLLRSVPTYERISLP
jgi:hypothetical protein